MKKIGIFNILFIGIVFSGCYAGYNMKPINTDYTKQDVFREAKYPESRIDIASYREESSEMVKKTFEELDGMERYTEKSKTSDDRFKRVMRDYKKDGE